MSDVLQRHWINNMASLGLSAYLLNLGFFPSAYLFLGGGISGAVCMMLERYLAKDDTLLNWGPLSSVFSIGSKVFDLLDPMWPWESSPSKQLQQLASSLPTIYTSMGASGSVFAFMGAETMYLYQAIRSSLKQLKKHDKHSKEWHAQIAHTSALTYMIAGRASSFLLQLLLMANAESSMEMTGHAAHVGGFVFGLLTMSWWKGF
jgi:membrane associated rhomboid family serine protease